MKHKRILIVEDNPVLGRLECRMQRLVDPDSEPNVVNDGLQALHLIERQSFDLVITDLSMPLVNGHELYLRTKTLCMIESRQVPRFIFCSGVQSALSGIAKHCAGGENRMLLKPFSEKQFADAVKELFLLSDMEDKAETPLETLNEVLVR
jgi:CheY-like chemotaxis protein